MTQSLYPSSTSTAHRPWSLEEARHETPGCQTVLHFNNAGAGLMPEVVLNTHVEYLKSEATIGGYETAARYEDDLEEAYRAVARLIHSKPQEIAIIENATRAWDMAFYSIPFKAGDRILTSNSEYASNYIGFLQVCQQTGAVVEPIPNDESGQIDIAALEAMMDERVKLIAISHIPTNGGLINPAKAVGQVAQKWNCLYLLDACQSVGQLPVDVQDIGCHILSATGRKYLRGPRGTGFLYVEESVCRSLTPPMLDLHAATWENQTEYTIRDDARRFENWETNFGGKVALGRAMNYALEWGIETTWERIQELSTRLRAALNELPGVAVCDLGKEQCGIVSFSIDTLPADKLSAMVEVMRGANINISFSPANYTRLDMESRGITGLLRASVHYYNTDDEIQRFIDTLKPHLR